MCKSVTMPGMSGHRSPEYAPAYGKPHKLLEEAIHNSLVYNIEVLKGLVAEFTQAAADDSEQD